MCQAAASFEPAGGGKASPNQACQQLFSKTVQNKRMMKFTRVMLIAVLVVSQSCRTNRNTNVHMVPTEVVTERVYDIHFNLLENRFVETEITDADSIAQIKSEFQLFAGAIKMEDADAKPDTISKYKLRFISETINSQNLGRSSTRLHNLKRCNQEIDLQQVGGIIALATSYTHKYLVMPKIVLVVPGVVSGETGNTYTRTFFRQCYFEKIQ